MKNCFKDWSQSRQQLVNRIVRETINVVFLVQECLGISKLIELIMSVVLPDIQVICNRLSIVVFIKIMSL